MQWAIHLPSLLDQDWILLFLYRVKIVAFHTLPEPAPDEFRCVNN